MRRPTNAGSALGWPSTVASTTTTGRGAGAGAGGTGMSGVARRAGARRSSAWPLEVGSFGIVLAAAAQLLLDEIDGELRDVGLPCDALDLVGHRLG
eukprot:3763651-Prymnesium_polylepis.1